MNFFSAQIVITNKTSANLDNSAILKIDSDNKGILLPRLPLTSNTDIITVQNPQNSNIVFNTNSTSTLPQTVAFFENEKWNAIYNKEQAKEKLDWVTVSSVVSPGNIIITGYTPGAISLGTGTSGWTSLGITETKSFTRVKNSLAFSLEGMAQIDKTLNEFYEYAIGIFVDDKLVVVRKYHKSAENNITCNWHKFILNGVVNNLSTGTHTIKVMARNVCSTSNSSTQSIYYGGIAHSSNTDNPPCPNMSEFLSKIVLSTTVVETLF